MLTHKGTKVIETERLFLRPAVREDAEAIFRNRTSDPEVTKYLTWPTHENLEITQWVVGSWLQGYEKNNFYQWLIEPKDLGQPIGTISVVDHNDRIEKCEIGYCIGKAWWRQGIMSEALGAVIGELFDHVGLSAVTARHDPRNPHSGAVMRKCGMTYTHTVIQQDRNNCGVCDADYYRITPAQMKKSACKNARTPFRNPGAVFVWCSDYLK